MNGFVIAALCAVTAACSAPTAPPKTTVTAGGHAHDAGDHNHARGKMLLASDGTYDALLTAHLSAKGGNELDIFIENKDGPYALSAKTLQATARMSGGEQRPIAFSCAPKEERPASEPEGTCSHYVALTPWIRAGELLRVDTALPVSGREIAMAWRDFDPKKYAHHEE
jgi:hypothetical protein